MHGFVLLNRILMLPQVGKIQVIAFQSLDGTQNTQRAIVPVITNPVVDPESSWSSSDNSLVLIEGIEQDTGDSRASNGSKVFFILDVVVLQHLIP